jgi:hypothetical protein
MQPAPAWQWSAPLLILASCLSCIGVFGWLDRANAVNAWRLHDWSALAPAWPLYLLASIACVCAQFALIGAARYMRRGSIIAGVIYILGAFFSAYSIHHGAALVVDGGARVEFELREHERDQLADEIERLQYIVDAERRQLPTPAAVGPRAMTAAVARFEAATASSRDRLVAARAELAASPRLPREPRDTPWLYILFVIWSFVEPWSFSVADGREHRGHDGRLRSKGFAKAALASVFGALAPITGAEAALLGDRTVAPLTTSTEPASPPATCVAPTEVARRRRPATAGARATFVQRRATSRRFSRDAIETALMRYHSGDAVSAICADVGCHRSQLYRWIKAVGGEPRRTSGQAASTRTSFNCGEK